MKAVLVPGTRAQSSNFTIGLILTVSASLISVVLLLHTWKEIPLGVLMRDPIAIAELPTYTGFLSQIGIFFWFSAAAICLFCAKVISSHFRQYRGGLSIKTFLMVSGSLTLLLGLDDAFLLHEGLFPACGIPETVVFSCYGSFILFYLFRYRSVILKTDYKLLGMALTCFGISIGLDVVEPSGIDPYLFEDGAKLVGIVSWLSYFVRVGEFAITSGQMRN